LLGEFGVVTASAVVAMATVGDFKQFRNGSQFRFVVRIDASSKFQWRQKQLELNHQAGRHVPAHAVDPGCAFFGRCLCAARALMPIT
jgi:hypothetical protein